MSGDETDRDHLPGKKCLAIKNMDWRNPAEDLKKFLRTLDHLHLSTRFGSDDLPLSGVFPSLRLPTNRMEAQPRVPTGLPRNFYNPRYLKKLNDFEYRRLDIQPDADLSLPSWLLQYSVFLILRLLLHSTSPNRIAYRFSRITNRQSKPLPRNIPLPGAGESSDPRGPMEPPAPAHRRRGPKAGRS